MEILTRMDYHGCMTQTQSQLAANHGTPDQFDQALLAALGEISYQEMMDASRKYRQEWDQALLDDRVE